MKTLQLKLKGRIPSKKNTRSGVVRGSRAMSFPSANYQAWHHSAGVQLLEHRGLLLENVEIQLDFYMPDNRKTDLDNKVSSVFDVLKDMGLIKDDSWQCVPKFYTKCAGIDKKNPRVEIWIRKL